MEDEDDIIDEILEGLNDEDDVVVVGSDEESAKADNEEALRFDITSYGWDVDVEGLVKRMNRESIYVFSADLFGRNQTSLVLLNHSYLGFRFRRYSLHGIQTRKSY